MYLLAVLCLGFISLATLVAYFYAPIKSLCSRIFEKKLTDQEFAEFIAKEEAAKKKNGENKQVGPLINGQVVPPFFLGISANQSPSPIMRTPEEEEFYSSVMPEYNEKTKNSLMKESISYALAHFYEKMLAANAADPSNSLIPSECFKDGKIITEKFIESIAPVKNTVKSKKKRPPQKKRKIARKKASK